MKTVITYGTFDLLHIGHINLLQRAKALGDKLIVALSTDEFNAEMKSKHCIQPYAERKLILESLMFVDMVIPEESWEQKVDDVQKHDVDVFVIGKDWEGKFDFLKTQCDVVYLERTEGVSTTERKNQIANSADTALVTQTINEISVVNLKKHCAVVFCITHNLVFAVANVIIGLKRHSPNLADDIYIYHNGITLADKEALLRISSNIIFMDFLEEQFLKRVTMNEPIQQYITKLSYIVFAKFEAIDLLYKYRSIIILGADMLIQKDISPIFESECVAWRPVGTYVLRDKIQNMELSPDASAPNGCLLYFTDKILEKSFNTHKCYDVLCELSCKVKSINDEIVYASISHLSHIPVTDLPVEYNCWPTYQNSNNSYIVHTAGPAKFWNSRLLQLTYAEWCINNNIWVAAGGSQYSGKISNEKLFKTNRDYFFSHSNAVFWQSFFSKHYNDAPTDVIPSIDIYKSYLQFYLPNVNRKIHFELTRISQEGYLNVALHCEDKSKIVDTAWKKFFKQLEFQSSVLNMNFVYNSKIEDARLEIHIQVSEETALESLRQLVGFAAPMVYTFMGVHQKQSALAYIPCEVINSLLDAAQKKQLTLENKVKEVATMLTAKYVEEHMTTAIAVNNKYDLLKTGIDAAQTDGTYFEFGVAKGATLKHIAKLAADQSVYGFDSFEGLPEDWRAGFRKGCFATTIPQLSAEYPNIKLVIGLFENSLPVFLKSAAIEKCSFIHIDCDLYSSTKTVLDLLAPFVRSGTIIVFDEYFSYPGWRKHEFKAFQEFVSYHGIDYEYVGYVNNGEQVCVRIK